MNRYMIDLIACITGAALWLLVMLFFMIKISLEKKNFIQSGKSLPKCKSSYILTLCASAILVALPFLILFQPFVTVVLELCAVLGAFLVLRERLAEFSEGNNDY